MRWFSCFRLVEGLRVVTVWGVSRSSMVVRKASGQAGAIENVPAHQASVWGKWRFAIDGKEGFSLGAGARHRLGGSLLRQLGSVELKGDKMVIRAR